MTKSIKFLLMLGCLIALFQICPTPDISADKDDDKDKPHSDEKEKPKSDKNKPGTDKPKPDKTRPKPDKQKPDKTKPDRNKQPPPQTKEKGRLNEFSEPYKEKSKPDKQKPAAGSNKPHHDVEKDDSEYSPRPHREEHPHRQEDKNKTVYVSYSQYEYDDSDYDDDETWFSLWTDFFIDNGFRYSSYPYNPSQQPLPGIYISQHEEFKGNPMAFQFRTYYHSIDKNLKSYGLYSKFLFASSLTWDMDNNHYMEKVNGHLDTMDYFTTHFNIAGLAPDTNFVPEIGVGMAFLTDVANEVHNSISFQTRMDYFPVEPWSFRIGASFASPSDVRTTNFDTTVGWHTGSLEIFGGYHSLVNNKTRNLNGPTFGLALWF